MSSTGSHVFPLGWTAISIHCVPMHLRIKAEAQIQGKLTPHTTFTCLHRRDGPQHIQLPIAAPMKELASGCWSFISTNSRGQDYVPMNA